MRQETVSPLVAARSEYRCGLAIKHLHTGRALTAVGNSSELHQGLHW